MIKILIALIILLWSVPAGATDYFVRKGASGNGSSWENAWGEMDQIVHASLSAGDTVWLAGGSYTTPITFTKSGTNDSNRIYFKRIRTTDAQCDAGCQSGGYDSQVIISPTAVTQSAGLRWAYLATGGSWVTIDGRVDNGIKINVTVQSTPQAGGFGSSGIGIWHAAQGVTIRYVEVDGPGGVGYSDPYTACNDEATITLHGVYGGISDLIVEYCNLHGLSDLIRHNGITNSIFRNNKLHDNYSLLSSNESGCAAKISLGYHVNMLISTGSSGGTTSYFYNNEIYTIHIEELLIGNSGVGGDLVPQTWYIFNNVFHSPLTTAARVVDVQYADQNIYLYNNTIANHTMLLDGTTYSGSSKTRNNLIYNCTGDWDSIITDSSYNWNNSTPDPFVSVAGDDYHLSSAVSDIANSGFDLTSYGITALNSDKDGVARPNGSAWDIGAYEYVTGTTPPSAKGLIMKGATWK